MKQNNTTRIRSKLGSLVGAFLITFFLMAMGAAQSAASAVPPVETIRLADWLDHRPIYTWVTPTRLLYSGSSSGPHKRQPVLYLYDLPKHKDIPLLRLTHLVRASGILADQPQSSPDGQWLLWCRQRYLSGNVLAEESFSGYC